MFKNSSNVSIKQMNKSNKNILLLNTDVLFTYKFKNQDEKVRPIKIVFIGKPFYSKL